MSSIRCSRVLAVLAIVAVVTAGTVMAVTVENEDVPAEAEVSDRVTASFTLTELYQNPNYNTWAVGGETELENVTWTIEFYNLAGDLEDQVEIDGQEIDSTRTEFSESDGVSKVVVKVTGDVPSIGEGNYLYPEKEQFLVAELVQAREGGASTTIGTWTAHHYADGGKEARNALDAADAAIEEAENSDAEVSEATDDFEKAVQAYESGNFELAVDLANDAESKANAATEAATDDEGGGNTMLLVGGGIVVLLIVVGGVFYWRQQNQQQDTRLR